MKVYRKKCKFYRLKCMFYRLKCAYLKNVKCLCGPNTFPSLGFLTQVHGVGPVKRLWTGGAGALSDVNIGHSIIILWTHSCNKNMRQYQLILKYDKTRKGVVTALFVNDVIYKLIGICAIGYISAY